MSLGEAIPAAAIREAMLADEPARSDAECRGVFLIVGASYSGSTLLNVLLGAHPAVAGGGELHWLDLSDEAARVLGPRGEPDGRCAFCGQSCAVWTPAVRVAITRDNLYELTARAFKKPFVCDASKMPDWSDLVARTKGAPVARVLLVKHPLRHVASFIEKARRFDHMQDLATIDDVLHHLGVIYAGAGAQTVDFVLRYEDLVVDPEGAITPLLARFGLSYDPAMDNWQGAEHHHIGGNAGPRSQIKPTARPAGGFLQRKYNRSDVFVDDSFAAILTPAEIDEIVRHPAALALCEMFGYDPIIAVEAAEAATSMDVETAKASLLEPVPLPTPFEHEFGAAYMARLELMPQHLFFAETADCKAAHFRSPLVLHEDGVPLGPAHTFHPAIRAAGEGRFSHWNEVLYFSASDNSDPNTNGRLYAISAIPDYKPPVLHRPWTVVPAMEVADAEQSLRAPVTLIGPFEPTGDHGWLARLRWLPQHQFFETVSDIKEAHTRSPLRLLEDDLPLGPAHTPHHFIFEVGEGRFSHWKEVLYFSTSDNSDPNTNGRFYAISV